MSDLFSSLLPLTHESKERNRSCVFSKMTAFILHIRQCLRTCRYRNRVKLLNNCSVSFISTNSLGNCNKIHCDRWWRDHKVIIKMLNVRELVWASVRILVLCYLLKSRPNDEMQWNAIWRSLNINFWLTQTQNTASASAPWNNVNFTSYVNASRLSLSL